MKKKDIIKLYREWRKENGNQKPNRVIVKMAWEDGDNTDKGYQIDTLGLENMDRLNFVDDPNILWYAETLDGLYDLTKPENGSEFVVLEVLAFYKA